MQNKSIRCCLRLEKMDQIFEEDIKSKNWLPTNRRVNKCIKTITFKFFNDTCTYYLK